MTPKAVRHDDAYALTHAAWRLLEAEKDILGIPHLRIQPAEEFIRFAGQYPTSTDERKTIIDQAALIFNHLYPHMPFKLDRFRLAHPSDFINEQIHPLLDSLSETAFHERMIAAFSLVRDAHTLYGLPSPYRGAVAFLPFQMRHYTDESGRRHYIVTKTMPTQVNRSFGHSLFKPGAEIVQWGAEAIDHHVQRTADRLPAANDAARFARGAIHSTLRPLTYCHLPHHDELPAAVIHYRPVNDDRVHTVRLPWAIATGLGQKAGLPGTSFSLSLLNSHAAHSGKVLHRSGEAPSEDLNQISSIPEIFTFLYTNGQRQHGAIELADLVDPKHPNACLGYIQIKSFTDGSSGPGSTDRIVNEFQRILSLMDKVAPDGLVLDIRGNPGGDVKAAERMLQMLTPGGIAPQLFHLANTPAVLQILRSIKTGTRTGLTPAEDASLTDAQVELSLWLQDAEKPVEGHLTSGQTLTNPRDANDTGQIYQGRVALLIDALTYSAADIFSAGFQDHSIGVILGSAETTGGGGANVWGHTELMDKLGPRPGIPLEKLPRDSSMSLAIRRCSRVGPYSGQPVEDVGVSTDQPFTPSCVEDVLHGYPSLIRAACTAILASGPFRVDVVNCQALEDGRVAVKLRTTNITSLKFLLDSHLALSISIEDGHDQPFTVPAVDGISNPVALRIEGYTADRLAAVRNIPLQQPAVDDQDTSTIDSDSDSGSA